MIFFIFCFQFQFQFQFICDFPNYKIHLNVCRFFLFLKVDSLLIPIKPIKIILITISLLSPLLTPFSTI